MIDRRLPGTTSETLAIATGRVGFAANFGIISGCFLLFTFLSWPILLSFDLWVFKDRSSFLNLDYLYFTRHLRPGVDIGYSYGLLPILLQHFIFLLFGRGYKPMIGGTFVVLLLSALFWACLLEHLPQGRRWLIAIIALSPVILIVNPNWPYSLAVLSMMFAFLFVLRERLDLALAISTIGCFCVPSLPLVLTVLLAICILFQWWRTPRRSISRLPLQLVPGVATYGSLAMMLGMVFGYASLAATVLPLAGARFYKESGYNKVGAFLVFLHPDGYGTKYYIAYYLASPVTWFVLCTLFLFACSMFIVVSVLRGNRLTPAYTVVAVFSIVQAVFVFFAYGPRGQAALYEGLLAAATLIGISMIPVTRIRNVGLQVFLGIGVMACLGAAYKSVDAWRTTAPGSDTLGLYAGLGISDSWSDVLSLSRHRKTLLLAYSTGQHLYYPTLTSPDAWFILSGLMFPKQEDEIIDQIRHADLVVEDLTSLSPEVSQRIQAELATLRVVNPGGPYRILEH